MSARSERVCSFIEQNWNKCIRYEPKDNGTLIGLPKPYAVPVCSGMFQEMYYWDTYFTCVGLILSRRLEAAKNCADNMAFMIDKYGFMPNGTRTYYLTRSQPPFFCMLVDAVFEKTGDVQWLKSMYFYVRKEYNFWQYNRMTPIGLNRFGAAVCGEEDGAKRLEQISERIGRKIDIREYDSAADFAINAMAECESGWDFNPRWSLHATDYAPADLNSCLYMYEKLMEKFSSILQNGEKDLWRGRAHARLERMNKYLWNGRNYADYNYVSGAFSDVFSAASFYPLWAGAASEEQARLTLGRLNEIEFDYGVVPCAKNDIKGSYQWDYPNLWAPVQFILIEGLKNYGFIRDAVRIAKKYAAAVENTFDESGRLWEKYNALTGGTDVVNEYDMPEMLGWTAGVYLYATDIIDRC